MRPWRRIVDLTHPITPEIPIWPGDPRPGFAELAGEARILYGKVKSVRTSATRASSSEVYLVGLGLSARLD